MATRAPLTFPIRPKAVQRPTEASVPWAVPFQFKAGLAIVLGAAIGLAATALALQRRIDPAAVHIGAWTYWPKAGTADSDPYARAIMAQTAEVPLAAAEGVTLTASRAARGVALDGRCSYRIDGRSPAARFWTLTLAEPDGILPGNAIDRHGFASSDLLRTGDGEFTIELSRSARAGNWLPEPAGAFVLILRLYESPLGTSANADQALLALPSITTGECAS